MRTLRASGFLLNAATRLRPVGLALDAPSGSGRNARFLSHLGFRVTCLDVELETLRTLRSPTYRLTLPSGDKSNVIPSDGGMMGAVCGDMLQNHLPFASAAFDLVVNIHYTVIDMIDEFLRVLKPGGYLLIETIGAHGGNHEQLPAPGELRERLASGFTLIRYAENQVPSPGRAAVTAKVLARRITGP